MRILIMAIVVLLLFMVGLMLQKLFQGPTIFARMNALGVITADTILLIVLFGFLDGQPGMYVDLAMAYAMMGCLGSVVLAKYLGGKKL
ncbi:MAG: monovalent cation/H+ antiporter complex subunit F [Schwartzia sp. (in: firmicutes)]